MRGIFRPWRRTAARSGPGLADPANAQASGEIRRPFRPIVSAVSAAIASAMVLGVLALGIGPVPALGKVLNPARGVWASTAGAVLPHSETLRLAGIAKPVVVSFTQTGVASVKAASRRDLFVALGYVHAEFRLTQMDLERRLGEGLLSQLVGSSALSSDKFELQLGLLRTARAQWAAMPKGSPSADALVAYADGINDWLAHASADARLPALYSLANAQPALWTPVDSLVVQEVLTQQLDFTTAPLDYAVLERSLGAARTMRWFPVLPPDAQHPFDTGPYRDLGVAAMTEPNANAAALTGSNGLAADLPASSGATARADSPAASGAVSRSLSGPADVTALLRRVSGLPATQVHRYPDSNAWAANGPAIAGGRAMLAGDPHLSQTLPSYWYEAALAAPGIDVSGATLPGVPGVLIGRNSHISWSLTDAENQATLFYRETVSAHHPRQYFWRGAWRPMRQIRYAIPVQGGGTVAFTVWLTVHGPIMSQVGSTTAVNWMGDYPSDDLAVMLEIDSATNFSQFRSAL
jgi:penicillin amidase